MADIAAADLALGRVTAIAIGMSTYTRRDRLSGVSGAMARCAAIARTALSAGMGQVVKFHVEPLEKSCGKGFHRRIVGVEFCMTNGTKGAVLISDLVRNELVHMTSHARFMARVG